MIASDRLENYAKGFTFSQAVRDLYCMLKAYHERVADELFPILSELGDTEAVN